MSPLVRLRLAIVVVGIGIAAFWSWYPVSYAFREAFFSSATPESLATDKCNVAEGGSAGIDWTVIGSANFPQRCGQFPSVQAYISADANTRSAGLTAKTHNVDPLLSRLFGMT